MRQAAFGLLLLLASSNLDAAEGGPDGFGYTWVDAESGCDTGLVPWTSDAQVISAPSSAVGPVSLPFPFPFYETFANEIWISPTGFVAFSDQGADGSSDVSQAFPDPTPPDDLIAASWGQDLANEIRYEAFAETFEVEWRISGPIQQDVYRLSLERDGSFRFLWFGSAPRGNRITVGYEDEAGARGRTLWRDGTGEPSFPSPDGGDVACVLAPPRLDCTDPVSLSCSETVPVRGPEVLDRDARVYACDPGTFPAHERTVRLDLNEPSGVLLALDQPDLGLFHVDPPPDCSEASCRASGRGSLALPLLFAGSHFFAVDGEAAGLPVDTELTTNCSPLPSLVCGEDAAGDTRLGVNAFPEHACTTDPLGGPEGYHGLRLDASGHLELTLDPPATGHRVVLYDSAGGCLASGVGGVALFDAPEGDYVVVVDAPSGVAGPYRLRARCGTRIACAGAAELFCGDSLDGATGPGPAEDPALYGCRPEVLDAAGLLYRFHNPVEQVVDLRLRESPPGHRVLLLESCDEGACRKGDPAGTCGLLPAGDYLVAVDGPAAAAGDFSLEASCSAMAAGAPDLLVTEVDPSDLTIGCDRVLQGDLSLRVTNLGEAPAPATSLDLLEDRNADGSLDAGDLALLQRPLPALDPGESVVVTWSLSPPPETVLTFRDAPLLVAADAADLVSEADEANNASGTAAEAGRCLERLRELEPTLEWEWSAPTVQPEFEDVMATPAVGDVNGDGVPDVVVATQKVRCGDPWEGAILRVLDGSDGSDLWTSDAPETRAACWTPPALADLDGDGRAEILVPALAPEHRLLALDDDGSLLWVSEAMPLLEETYGGAAAVADLDGDGSPEISFGPAVLNADGTLFWTPESGGTEGGFTGPRSIFLDLDGNGVLEVVAGATAYRWDAATATGAILWQSSEAPDGFNAAGDFDDDPFAEIVVVGNYRTVLLDQDGTLLWDSEISMGFDEGGCEMAPFPGAGVPAVADLDGDLAPEVVVAAGQWITAFETNGAEKWRAPIDDCSSGTSSIAAFDLDGDGGAEVIHRDQAVLRALRGTTGEELWTRPASSLTLHEGPVIADVDADGQAEIVVPNDHLDPSTGFGGIRVYGGAGLDGWSRSRRLWNQDAYHVTNITDMLRAPRPSTNLCAPPSPTPLGLFRAQEVLPDPPLDGTDLTLALLEAEVLETSPCEPTLRLLLRVGNAGGVPSEDFGIALYDGDPATGGLLLGTEAVAALAPGGFVDVEVRLPAPRSGPVEVHAVADDDGSGTGVVFECREDNNACIAHLEVSVSVEASEPSALDLDPSSEPLRVARPTDSTELLFTWQDLGLDHGYRLYRGQLGLWYSHEEVGRCSVSAPSARLTPAAGSAYYLVTGTRCEGLSESSYGRDASSAERPAASPPCP